VSKFPEDDQKNDEAGNPGISLVGMDNLISEQGNQEGRSSNNDDSSPAGHVSVNSVEKLCSNDHVDRRPTNTSENVETGDDFDSIVLRQISF
jgi:hypothetical protein